MRSNRVAKENTTRISSRSFWQPDDLINRREVLSSFFSIVRKVPPLLLSKPAIPVDRRQNSLVDADLLTDPKRLRRIGTLFKKLGKLLNHHSSVTAAIH
jgi:hypothetical protein